ncbi:MAG: RNA methyltransferase [Pseudomonadota bacterium]
MDALTALLARLLLILPLILAGCVAPEDQEAARVLRDIAAGPYPSELKETTPRPERITQPFTVEGRQSIGDLYRPLQPVGAPLVLVPGLSPDGKDDARLVALAETLARARFLVLVPDLEAARQLKISLDDARTIGDAAIHLARLTRADGFAGVGIAAISYAVGPAMIAALDPRVSPHVSFVLGLGGYYDSEHMMTFLTTGFYREPGGGIWRRHRTNPAGMWVFVLSNLDRIENPQDRRRLQTMAERRLADADAPIADLAAGLGREGRAVYALLANRDPDKVPGLLAALPAPIRHDLDALSLNNYDLTPLSGRAILIHGEDDPVIPYTESEELARAIGKAELFLVPGFSHVDRTAVGPAGQLVLMRAMRALLDRRRPLKLADATAAR